MADLKGSTFLPKLVKSLTCNPILKKDGEGGDGLGRIFDSSLSRLFCRDEVPCATFRLCGGEGTLLHKTEVVVWVTRLFLTDSLFPFSGFFF